jgi:hypothetical protein
MVENMQIMFHLHWVLANNDNTNIKLMTAQLVKNILWLSTKYGIFEPIYM